jgi:hypothetical protein
MENMVVEDHDDDTEGGGVAVEQETKDEEKLEPQNEYVEGEDAEPYERVGEEDKELSTKGDRAFERYDITEANTFPRNR